MKKIKIAQIGIGHEHAIGKICTIRNMPDYFELMGVAIPDPEAFQIWHSEGVYEKIPRLSLEELFKIPDLDAVLVEVDCHDLVSVARQCMEHGLHIHMDKPGGEELAPFQTLVEGCRKRDLIFQVGYMYRNNPGLSFCRKAMQNGWLGKIFSADISMNRFDNDDFIRKELSKFKGGSMFYLGCHLTDLAVSFLGRPERVTPYLKSTRFGVMDNGLAVLEYPEATVTIRSAMTEPDGFPHRRFLLCGTKGTVELMPIEGEWGPSSQKPLIVRMTLLEDNAEYKAGTTQINAGLLKKGRYDDQLIEFARAIRGELENPYSYQHELTVFETVLKTIGM